MADRVTQSNIGGLIQVVGSVPGTTAQAAATVNGASVDRAAHNMPLSCVLHANVSAIAGAPTTTAAAAKLQHAPDNATWTDYKPDGINVATGTLTAVGDLNVDIDLALAQRYIRAVLAVSFTGGASPTVDTYVSIALGGEQELAAI